MVIPTYEIVFLCYSCCILPEGLNLSDVLQQEDVRNYIDNSLKHGVQLPAFRKERIGGDSHGISYWYIELVNEQPLNDIVICISFYHTLTGLRLTKHLFCCLVYNLQLFGGRFLFKAL